jgi:diguanylate cyclase (GGDEF)-like protein
LAISTYLADVWSATEFDDPELSGYAEKQLCKDTRLGIQAMAGLSLLMQLSVAALIFSQEIGDPYITIVLLFGLLSVLVLFSAAYLKDVRTLYVLGMAFLIIGALCLTSLAHLAGELHIGLMAAAIMLFIAIPLVPWALRETSIVIGLSYLLLTLSLIVVPGRFDAESLWTLRLLVLGAAVIVLVVTGRNTYIRKQDLRARFELESTQNDMELLSMQDHLTGAWNRRYLSEKFSEFSQYCLDQQKVMQVAILDIDDFKGINDEFGHQFGDKILISVADIFVRLLEGKGRLIRLGGDEFQIIYCGDGLDRLIETAVAELQQQFSEAGLSTQRVISLSAGIVSSKPGHLADLESLYKSADHALYDAKNDRPVAIADETNPLARTGTWRL